MSTRRMYNSAIRTVKNGAVQVGGKVFRPCEYYEVRDGLPCSMPYTGQLDGMRLVFGRYWVANEYNELISLCGAQRAEGGDDWLGPNCIGGVIYFMFWYTEDYWQRDQAKQRELDAITEQWKAKLEAHE